MLQSMRTMTAVAICATLTTSLALPAAAQTALENLIAAAKSEGLVIVDTATTRFPAESGPNLSKAMSEKFGVDIKVELTNSAPAPVMTGQIIEEAKAGIAPAVDLVSVPYAFTKALNENGAIQDIDWASLGVDPSLISKAGNSVWVNTVARAVVYNVNLVKGDDIPTKLEDLLDPKWKGKIAGPGFGDAYGMIAVPVLGEEKAAEWVKALYEDQGLAVISSMTDVPNRVANGEFMIGMGVSANYSGLVDKGAPIANAPLEKIGGQPYYSFVVNKAPHPNAAALLAYFMCCTAEGRKALLGNMGWSMFDTEGSEQYALGSNGRGVTPSEDWQLNEQSRVGKAMDKLIGR